MNEGSLVLLFLKAPVSGAVKTRLARDIGNEAALELYRRFILDAVDGLTQAGHRIRLCYAPAEARDAIRSLLPAQRDLLPQEGGDLGERMENAFRTAFAGGFTRVLLLGSDIPDLPPAIIEEGFTSLLTNDLVLGPASDGGYYLVGSTPEGFLPDLFHDIPWSTDSVLRLSVKAAATAGRTLHLLPSWQDVDSAADLKDLARRNRDSAFGGSRTMEYLRKGLRS